MQKTGNRIQQPKQYEKEPYHGDNATR